MKSSVRRVAPPFSSSEEALLPRLRFGYLPPVQARALLHVVKSQVRVILDQAFVLYTNVSVPEEPLSYVHVPATSPGVSSALTIVKFGLRNIRSPSLTAAQGATLDIATYQVWR